MDRKWIDREVDGQKDRETQRQIDRTERIQQIKKRCRHTER